MCAQRATICILYYNKTVLVLHYVFFENQAKIYFELYILIVVIRVSFVLKTIKERQQLILKNFSRLRRTKVFTKQSL